MNNAEVLCHSSGPWKKHKYFQKIGEGANAVYKYSKKAAGEIKDKSGITAKQELNEAKELSKAGSDLANEYSSVAGGFPNDKATTNRKPIENDDRGRWAQSATNSYKFGERHGRDVARLQSQYYKTPLGKAEKTAKATVAKGEQILKNMFKTKTTVTVTSNLMPPGTKKTIKSN